MLEACALTPDLESLPKRDATLIGSKGQNVTVAGIFSVGTSTAALHFLLSERPVGRFLLARFRKIKT